MIANPYLIEGPALISFSGGRTSGYMLHEILAAHGGALPPDVLVGFTNTALEREETLRFIYECGLRWNIDIHWLERTPGGGYAEVGFNSASRNGEPFAQLILEKGYLPNAVTRFCTSELKVRPMRDFGRSLGWTHWKNIIGLRYDEGHRVFKALARNDANKEPFKAAMPLARAHAVKRDIMEFWLGSTARFPSSDLPQGFDLGLRDYEGNCSLCFLKSRRKLTTIMHERPDAAAWWIEQEVRIGARFVTEYGYSELARTAAAQTVFPFIDDGEDHDAECGLVCAA